MGPDQKGGLGVFSEILPKRLPIPFLTSSCHATRPASNNPPAKAQEHWVRFLFARFVAPRACGSRAPKQSGSRKTASVHCGHWHVHNEPTPFTHTIYSKLYPAILPFHAT